MTASRLTVILPLKGRHLFTLRFLWHADRARLPYRFIIADGQVHPVLADLLEKSRTLFPNLDIEYIRYPDDNEFRDFCAKMADAVGRVRTPYVVLADNDDFLAFTGIERSLDFLDAHPDYICCGGGISGFSVYAPQSAAYGGLVGPLNKIAFRYMPNDRSIDVSSDVVSERLLFGIRNSWTYYAVFRSQALPTIWRELVELDLSDLQLQEKFCAMRTLTLGKARSDPATVAYLRQYWTSMQSAFSVDWVHHLVRSRFSTDLKNIVERIAGIAAKQDKADPTVLAESLLGRIEMWLRDFINLNYGISGTVRRHIRSRAPGLLMWLKTRRRFSVSGERKAIIATLRQRGATEDYIAAFRSELAQIEDVITGAEFRDFIGRYAKELTAVPKAQNV